LDVVGRSVQGDIVQTIQVSTSLGAITPWHIVCHQELEALAAELDGPMNSGRNHPPEAAARAERLRRYPGMMKVVCSCE
jgi:hypothetical protein